MAFLVVYFDDSILVGTPKDPLDQRITSLHYESVMKNLGCIHYFLGMKAKTAIFAFQLIQSNYIFNILLKTNINDYMLVSILTSFGSQFSHHDCLPLFDFVQYRHAVATLRHLTLTYHDIIFAVNMSIRKYIHFYALTCIKYILHYSKYTIDYSHYLIRGSASSLHG